MRYILILLIIAISGVAIADDTATRVAVIEKDVKLLREDVSYLRDHMLTKTEYQMLCDRLDEIRDLVNPKLEKVDTLIAWSESHVRVHDTIEQNKNRSTVLWLGIATILFTAISIGTNFLIGKRNGNRG